jgi:hypothetical protein
VEVQRKGNARKPTVSGERVTAPVSNDESGRTAKAVRKKFIKFFPKNVPQSGVKMTYI